MTQARTLADFGGGSGTGKVLQVVVHQETAAPQPPVTFGASTANQYLLLSAANASDSTAKMEVTITPSSASSKILIHAIVHFEPSVDSHDTIWTLYRNGSTRLGQPDQSNRRGGIAQTVTSLDANNDSTIDMANILFEDSPNTTSATTYTMAYNNSSAMTVYLNRVLGSSDSSGAERLQSIIMAQEIAV
tara:strand:- start:2837 stop:3403 length:567 start_codon:yes stop_codon:yes gene_type:complete